MKRLFLLFYTLMCTVAALAQAFEGQVSYDVKFTSKMRGYSDEQFTSMMGSRQEYFIKGGRYKSASNGLFSDWVMYDNKTNRMYVKMMGTDTVIWNDASVNQDSILHMELKKEAMVILGYTCDELTLSCKSGMQKYYFSPKLKLNTKAFEKHRYGNWAVYAREAQAVPLRMIIESAQFTMDAVATAVSPRKISDGELAMPAKAILKAAR